MVAKKSVKLKVPEKKIFTDSTFLVNVFIKNLQRRNLLKMLESILLLEAYILECSVKDFGP
jgi:hypothetical protein